MKQTRRKFLKSSTALALGTLAWPGCVSSRLKTSSQDIISAPWYRRTFRWGQTNITEADAAAYDIAWWRSYWKTTQVQGLIINAGGIVAYYPTNYPLHYRPPGLGARDLFGELLQAARAEGLVVLARMDSNRAHRELYEAHPDWFTVDAAGRPYQAGELYISCVNGPYYDEYLPGILQEIIRRYHPAGFADNSWSGLDRERICYCANCERKFRERNGRSLPRGKNWDDPGYRDWILWNYQRRLELWDHNNGVTRASGGQDCLWVGMNSGSITGQCQSFRDYKGICARAEFLLLDHQAGNGGAGFAQNAEIGQLIHSLLGWNKLVPESMAMYQAGRATFRKTSRPEPDARLWMVEAFAGGLQPWWHHVGAQQEDARQFQIAPPIYQWHAAHQQYLIDREPIASVGLVWSQQNVDFFGRDHPAELVEQPWRGWSQALLRARIPFLPVHADDLDSATGKLSVLILPNLGALSDRQAATLRRFVQQGGALIATGRTGLYDEWGQPRPDFALADVLGCHYVSLGRGGERPRENYQETLHTYLRIESPRAEAAAEIVRGFEDTALLPFGGWLGDVIASEAARVPLTFIPAFPVYPPETSWMRDPKTNVPALVLNPVSGARVAFLIADLDRRFANDSLPDHGRLLGNLVRWAGRGSLPFEVEGPGLIDCRLYRQANRLILHLVNLTNTGRGPVDEFIPVGPLRISLLTPQGQLAKKVRPLVGSTKLTSSFKHGKATILLPSLLDHQVLLLE